MTIKENINPQSKLIEIEKQYKLSTSKDNLNKKGQYFTPEFIGQEITDFTFSFVNFNSVKFLEPAFGLGSFYDYFLRTIEKKEIPEYSATGVEKYDDIISFAQDIWKHNNLSLIHKSFEHFDSKYKYNLLITNPPYVRHHHLNLSEKKALSLQVQKETGYKLSGYSGLYVYFIFLAHKFLEKGAVSTWLIPAEFMSVNYGKELRDYLTKEVTLKHIHKYDINNSKFDNALVSSAVITFINEKPSDNDNIILSHGESILDNNKEISVNNKTLFETDKWSKLFNNYILKDNTPMLGDFFETRRGIATGNNEFFIIPKYKADELGIPKCAYKPILPSLKKVDTDVIFSDEEGNPLIDNPLVVIDTDMSKEDMEVTAPKLLSLIKEAENMGINEKYLLRKRKIWYKQERRNPSPFIVSYMARGKENSKNPFRIIWNQSNAIVTNSYIMLYPKGKLQKLLEYDPSLYEKVFKALKNIDVSHFINNGREYGGGLKKLEPKEMKSLPVDNLIEELPELI